MFQGKSDSWLLSLPAYLRKTTAADGMDLSVIHTQHRIHEKYKYWVFLKQYRTSLNLTFSRQEQAASKLSRLILWDSLSIGKGTF